MTPSMNLFRANILYAKPEASVEEVMRAAALAEIHDQVRFNK